MWSYAKRGWSTARRSAFLIFLLFLYQYVIGYLLFRYVKSHVVPLLHRFPGGELSDYSTQLFLLEAQFRLLKTDLIQPYLWAFAGFLAVRMLLTPLINCGIFSALSHGKEQGGHRRAFFRGIRTYARPFLLLYMLQIILAAAPLIWAVPQVLEYSIAAHHWTEAATRALPIFIGWLAYQGVLDLIFMYIGFAIVNHTSVWTGLAVASRRFYHVLTLSLSIFAITAGIGLATAALTLWAAGFIAVLIHLVYPLLRTVFNLWAIASQHHLWSVSQSSSS